MRNLLREYIREQINILFEEDRASTAASSVQGVKSDADTTEYDALKTQQLSQIDTLKKNLEKDKVKQKVSKDKLDKLNKTFSQVQDTDLAIIPGGKSLDNTVKTAKKSEYTKNQKQIEDEIKDKEKQIGDAEKMTQNIDTLKKQAEAPVKSASTPSTPVEP